MILLFPSLSLVGKTLVDRYHRFRMFSMMFFSSSGRQVLRRIPVIFSAQLERNPCYQTRGSSELRNANSSVSPDRQTCRGADPAYISSVDDEEPALHVERTVGIVPSWIRYHCSSSFLERLRNSRNSPLGTPPSFIGL